MGRIVLACGILTLVPGQICRGELVTPRDLELNQLLQQTNQLEQESLLSERSARLNILRRRYTEIMERNTWALQSEIKNTSGFNDNQGVFSGFSGSLQGVFQFAENWQVNSAWLLAHQLKNRNPIQRSTALQTINLENLMISFGKQRSVEANLGIRPDPALISGESTQPQLTEIAIRLHPLTQNISPQSQKYIFEIAHGWTSLRPPTPSPTERQQIQRTRPQIKFHLRKPKFEVDGQAALEWYTDRDALLGKIAAQRPHAESETLSSDESKWRLFALAAETRLRPNEDHTDTVRFERTSNSIGKNATPAWSLLNQFGQKYHFENGRLEVNFSLQFFQIPAGSVPPARLPLEISPATRGRIFRAGAAWLPAQAPQHQLSFEISQKSEHSLSTPVRLGCATSVSNESQSCRLAWITLGWSLIIAPNL